MYEVKTMHIDEWGENDTIDLTCPVCHGEGESCEHCGGNGIIEPMWNTVYKTGLHDIATGAAAAVLKNTNCFVAYHSDEGEYIIGLTGCGMDLTASLAKAWMILGFEWLPVDWIQSMIRSGADYCEYVAGKSCWRYRLLPLIRKTLRNAANEVKYLQQQLRMECKKQAQKRGPSETDD